MKALILSDIHGNWPALQAVLKAEPDADVILCLGDIVNYGPHPVECLEWVRENLRPGHVVQGNHDRALGLNQDSRCSAKYREMALAMQDYTASQLSDEQKAYLAALPASSGLEIEGTRMLLVHATPSDPFYSYVQADDHDRWEDEVVLAGHPDYLLVGHTHLPFVRQVRDTIIVNPGSVGQPKDDDPGAAYVIWDGVTMCRCRASYDVKSAARDLKACVSPEIAKELAAILANGGWPVHPLC